MYKKKIKPVWDFIFAFLAIVFLSPVFIIVSIIIKLESKGPVFFIQERLGKDGRIFNIIKFRSMTVGDINFKDDFENYYNNPRITRFGKIIRQTSIDELPQLINIIKGDMSLIGPRPPLPYFPKNFQEYNAKEKIGFSVKPGLSGLVQVRDRRCDDWDKNIPVDLDYVKNISFKMDVKIFFLSFLSFFK